MPTSRRCIASAHHDSPLPNRRRTKRLASPLRHPSTRAHLDIKSRPTPTTRFSAPTVAAFLPRATRPPLAKDPPCKRRSPSRARTAYGSAKRSGLLVSRPSSTPRSRKQNKPSVPPPSPPMEVSFRLGWRRRRNSRRFEPRKKRPSRSRSNPRSRSRKRERRGRTRRPRLPKSRPRPRRLLLLACPRNRPG